MGADGTEPLGSMFGQAATTLTAGELPAPAGTGQPVNNDQPSLALNYLIAIAGIFPSNGDGAGFDQNTATLGEIVAFAGNFVPSGWALANGQILPIASNTALFSLLGTQYGGNGTSTFALPNLSGRSLIGSGSSGGQFYSVGQAGGSDTTILNAANMPRAACFTHGTRIATCHGAVPIEVLSPGDRVVLAGGGNRPVIWMGHRTVDCAVHPTPWDVWPVRVLADAFGQGQPSRDLRLSPDHAVFIDGVLIPVRYLLNDTTIIQEQADAITYWHVELDAHDILLAEGLPSESYLDTGNRSAFENAGSAVQLHADFALRVWDERGCAALVRDGAQLEAARSHLRERARSLGFATASNPVLRLIVDGQVIPPQVVGRLYRFEIPPAAREIRLTSRSAVPARTRIESNDHRRLGVAISHIALDGVPIMLDDCRLGFGWHDREYHGTAAGWRWTDGNAGLALAGVRKLEISVLMTECYWTGRDEARRRVA